MKNKGEKLAGIFMALGGAIIIINAFIEWNAGMILSGIGICIAGVLYFVPPKED